MRLLNILPLLFIVSLTGCSKEDDKVPESKLNHQGQKWRIESVEYNIVDPGFSDPTSWVQTGTANNAGAFYFNGSEGSFDIIINNKRKEDYFGYTFDGGSVTILSIEQNISISKFSQNVIAINGDKTDNTMSLNGTITKQGTSGQYVFTGTFSLVRE